MKSVLCIAWCISHCVYRIDCVSTLESARDIKELLIVQIICHKSHHFTREESSFSLIRMASFQYKTDFTREESSFQYKTDPS